MSQPFITWDVQQHCLSHAIEPPHHSASHPRFPSLRAVESCTTTDKPASTVSKCLGLQAACRVTHRFMTPKALGFHLLSQKELPGCLVESHSLGCLRTSRLCLKASSCSFVHCVDVSTLWTKEQSFTSSMSRPLMRRRSLKP